MTGYMQMPYDALTVSKVYHLHYILSISKSQVDLLSLLPKYSHSE